MIVGSGDLPYECSSTRPACLKSNLKKGNSMKKHALILGTLAGQAEAMEWLKDNGWLVSACGHVQEGPGVATADHFYLVDILNIEKVTELARDIKADVVYSVGSDIAMPTVARVSETLGLPCFHNSETTSILHRKVLTRQFLNDHNISTTSFQKLRTVEDVYKFKTFPAILKPADSQGQRGIFIVESVEEAARLVPQSFAASKTSEAIIEELIDGPEISVHAFVVDSKLVFFQPSDRHTWEGPAVGVPTGHVLPSHFTSKDMLPRVRDLVESCVSHLKVANGPLYFQMKLSKEHGPKIIEIAPRLDGCHMWRVVEYYTGVNLIAACFNRLLGLPWQYADVPEPTTPYSLWFFLQKTGETFQKSLHALPADANCVYQHFLYTDGQKVRPTNGIIEKVGYYILKG
ncbi:ATP-grasp domain-containing protein [Desulfolutivibrio sulfoxidireducens]|nr:ATP-grasp domain-containing protein [Desulfolutivibrio sulfoxidireducens]